MPSETPESRLRLAVQRDDIKTARELLESGVDFNAQDNKGFTALMIAARNGRTACAELLLQYGADMDKTDKQGNSALVWASFYGNEEIAISLAGKGADLNLRGSRGTALTCATFFNREEIVRTLLRYGADMDQPDPVGKTAKRLAREKGFKVIDGLLHDVTLRKLQNNLRDAARRKRPRPKFKP